MQKQPPKQDGGGKINQNIHLQLVRHVDNDLKPLLIYYLETLYTMDNDFKVVDPKRQYLFALAKYGGPIAVMRYLEQPYIVTQQSKLQTDLCFFANDGKLMRNIAVTDKIPVACFSFTQDELLLIFLDNGKYYLVDPNKNATTELQTFEALVQPLSGQRVFDAKVQNNELILCSVKREVSKKDAEQLKRVSENEEIQFYHVKDLKKPSLSTSFCPLTVRKFQFKASPQLTSNQKLQAQRQEEQIKQQKAPVSPSGIQATQRCWAIIPKERSLSGSMEIVMAHQDSGINSLIEQEEINAQARVYFNDEISKEFSKIMLDFQNKILNIPDIRLIALSPGHTSGDYPDNQNKDDQIAYLSRQSTVEQGRTTIKWKLFVVSIQLSSKIYLQDLEIVGLQKKLMEEYFEEKNPIQIQNPDTNRISEEEEQFLQPQSMHYCGDNCIVIATKKFIFAVAPINDKAKLYPEQNFRIGDTKNQGRINIFPEVDGCRIFNTVEMKMLRCVPNDYIQIFQIGATNHARNLYESYISYNEMKPKGSERQTEQEQMREAVKSCLIAGQWEWQDEQQRLLIEAAGYGKTGLDPSQVQSNQVHGEFAKSCKMLRIIHALRESPCRRTITYDQLKSILNQPKTGDDLLTNLFLRYKMHYAAAEVAKINILDQEKVQGQNSSSDNTVRNDIMRKIYIDWACCKVGQKNLSDEQLCQQIVERLQEMPGVPYTEIAYQAVKEGKHGLALLLIKNESSQQKKVPLLLWMANYEKEDNHENIVKHFQEALSQAQDSKDSNLIYLAVMRLIRNIMDLEDKIKSIDKNDVQNRVQIRDNLAKKQDDLYKLIFTQKIVESHLISYLRLFNERWLQQYFQKKKDNHQAGFYAIEQAYNTPKLDKRVRFLNVAAEFLNAQREAIELPKPTPKEGIDPEKLKKSQQAQADVLYAQLVQQESDMLSQFYNEVMKGDPNIGQAKAVLEEYKEVSVNSVLEMFFRTEQHEDAKKLQEKCKISDKRFLLTRVRVMIKSRDKKEIQKMIKLVKEKNRKKMEVPYEIVADLLRRELKEGSTEALFKEEVCELLYMMPDVEEMIQLLLRCQYEKEAFEQGIKHDKEEYLSELRNQFTPEWRQKIDEIQEQTQNSGNKK